MAENKFIFDRFVLTNPVAAHQPPQPLSPRTLGRTGLAVPPLGLGCNTFGREIDERTSFELMDYAVEHGITLFDTAEAYGGGQARAYRRETLHTDDIREVSGEHHSSEKIIGRWLKASGARNLITLVSKVSTNFTTAHVRQALDASLERLCTDHLDLYLFHSYDSATPLEEALQAMEAVRRVGQIRFAGCSNFTGAQLREALSTARRLGLCRLEVIEAACSLVARDAETDLLPMCREEQIGFLAYSPLGAGFLTGKYSGDGRPLPEGSRFHVIPGHADVYFHPHNFEAVTALHRAAAAMGVPPLQLAVAWVLAHREITTVLCGARTIDHLDNALQATRLELSGEWMDAPGLR